MLLIGNFMVVSYIMYPIEVIRPGWLNFSRIVQLYAFWLLLLTVYLITSLAGVRYTSYSSLLEMIANVGPFEVWFCLFLCLLLFTPGLLVIFIQRIGHNSNTDRVWLKKYASAFYINILAYLMLLTFNHPLVHTLYYYVSVGCSLYIVYMELFDRLLAKTAEKKTPDEPVLQETLFKAYRSFCNSHCSVQKCSAGRAARCLYEKLTAPGAIPISLSPDWHPRSIRTAPPCLKPYRSVDMKITPNSSTSCASTISCSR